MQLNLAKMLGRQADLLPRIAMLVYFLLSLAIVWHFPSTFDSGDSLMHFEFAHWAWQHPVKLLDHWGKPVFTLLAAPFARFGFGGIQLMQCLLIWLIAWALWRSGKRLGLKWPWMASLLALCSPMLFLMQFSGLTEPMFGAFLAVGVMLALDKKPLASAILLSFLPFVRTEGFLLLPAFALWFAMQKDWRSTLLLGLGTLLYMLVGGMVFRDLLWIWTKNPYAGLGNYGSGSWLHFFEKFVYVVGIPGYGLMGLGLIATLVASPGKSWPQKGKWLLLVMAPFGIYFGAHVVFWATGTGHSMGLHRVLVAVVPMAALLGASGLEMLLGRMPARMGWLRNTLLGLICGYLLIFPFTANPASFHARDFQLGPDQVLLEKAHAFVLEHGLQDRKLYAAHPGVAFHLGRDPFDSTQVSQIEELQKGKPPIGSLLLWDNWFAKLEGGVPEVFWQDNAQDYRLLNAWEQSEGKQLHQLQVYESY